MSENSIVTVPLERPGIPASSLSLFHIKTAELQRKTRSPQGF